MVEEEDLPGMKKYDWDAIEKRAIENERKRHLERATTQTVVEIRK